MDQTHIWVTAHDGGYEGFSPPLHAFISEEEARRAVAMVNNAGASCLKIFKVPLYPTVCDVPYYNLSREGIDAKEPA